MNRRILIIDDERDIRDVAAASLELVGGFSVLTEASGKAGIAAARREHPDAILLDLMMPEMDGCETLTQLKQDDGTKYIPVILLTAKALSLGQATTAADVAGVMVKPFDPMRLASEVEAILGWEREGDASA
jgi:two-component system alkaline phosphatase synthesis response regulator PhoP